MISVEESVSIRRWRTVLGREVPTWPVSIEDWADRAAAMMEDGPRGYVFGGAGRGSTRDANVTAYDAWQIMPRMLSTPRDRDLSVTFFGTTYATPLFLSPIGVLSIAHPDGDEAVARAASEHKVAVTVSTASSSSMEDIAAESTSPLWYQLYWVNNRSLTESFVRRAEAANYEAIVVTVDTPMLGWREQDLSGGYSPFSGGHGIGQFVSDPIFCSLLDFDPAADPGRAGQEMMKLFVNPGVGWEDMLWLRSLTDLPIFIKGILRADDAQRSVDAGLNGIIVSNHGGRQIDGCISSLDALPAIRDQVGDEFPLILDGGIRRGSDVVKAIALGADAVMVGRPYVYGLTVGGQTGVSEVLANLIAETDSVLALSGYASLGDLDRSALNARPSQ